MTIHPDAGDPQDDIDIDIDLNDDESLALAAASAALALGAAGPIEPLPASLQARVEADARRHFFADSPAPARRSAPGWKLAAAAGWLAAAAAWVVLALPGSSPRSTIPPRPIPANPPAGPSGWTGTLKATDHPLARGAGGALVWDQGGQAGVLKIRGLAGVRANRGVYQLWIFDAGRDPRYPVDAGTFAVDDPSATTVVPVRARLPVVRPTLFAVTLEPPGGVVVSDRQRIMLTAAYP